MSLALPREARNQARSSTNQPGRPARVVRVKSQQRAVATTSGMHSLAVLYDHGLTLRSRHHSAKSLTISKEADDNVGVPGKLSLFGLLKPVQAVILDLAMTLYSWLKYAVMLPKQIVRSLRSRPRQLERF